MKIIRWDCGGRRRVQKEVRRMKVAYGPSHPMFMSFGVLRASPNLVASVVQSVP